MSRRAASIALLGLVALAAGIALLPREEEHAVMAYRDGNIAGAIGILNHLAATDTSNGAIRMQLYRLHEQAGHAAASIAALESYLAQNGKDAPALEKLADLYRATMQTEGRREALERLLPVAAPEARVRELLGLYRLSNNEDAEFTLLRNPRAAPALSREDIERRAALALARGKIDIALASFSEADGHALPEAFESRLAYLDLLLGQKRFEQAAERIVHWSKGWRNGEDRILIAVMQFARSTVASAVVDLVGRIGAVRPGLDMWLAQSLAYRGHQHIARGIYRAAASSIDATNNEAIVSFVAAAAASQDVEAAFKMLYRFLDSPEHSLAAARTAETMMVHFGSDALLGEPRILTPSFLSIRPLFGAELALEAGNPFLASRVLSEGSPTAVPARGARRYVQLLCEFLGPFAATHKVIQAAETGLIEPLLATALQDEARRAGIEIGANMLVNRAGVRRVAQH